VDRRRGTTETMAGRLHALSPVSTLARGYSIARGGDGRTLGSVAQFAAGDAFELLLRDGRVSAIAKSIDVDSDLGGGAA
jgi:exodeoxyribonuclease VII large subunit